MKKVSVLITSLTIVFTLISCNNTKQTTVLNTKQTSTSEVMDENQNWQVVPDISDKDKLISIIPGKDGQPDEVNIASEHKIKIDDYWFSKSTSSDGKYYIYDSGEYNYTYERYCVPIEGERKDLNLIMLKEESALFNPDDMGSNKKNICSAGCEFVPLARSKNQINFNEQTSYWFRVTVNTWIPGVSVYIQPGVFEKLPVEDLEVGMPYEKIKDGTWFIVKTDDGSSLRLRDSSNIKTGNVILSIPQGTWIYADSQTSSTETIDGIESRWYKIAYPEKGYVFGGYLEKQDEVCGLEFASFVMSEYKYDDSKDCIYKIYSAPTEKSEFLGEYEIKPDESGYYSTTIETNQLETVNGVNGVWIYIKEPVQGFIFGHNFIYK